MSRSQCQQLDRDSCEAASGYLCGWNGQRCAPATDVSVLREKHKEQRQAKGGWAIIGGLYLAAMLVLMYAIEAAFDIPTFAFVSGDFRRESWLASTIVGGVLLATMYAVYLLWARCNYSFACFLIGGEGGALENPVELLREQQRRQQMQKQRFLRDGQRFDMASPGERAYYESQLARRGASYDAGGRFAAGGGNGYERNGGSGGGGEGVYAPGYSDGAAGTASDAALYGDDTRPL